MHVKVLRHPVINPHSQPYRGASPFQRRERAWDLANVSELDRLGIFMWGRGIRTLSTATRRYKKPSYLRIFSLNASLQLQIESQASELSGPLFSVPSDSRHSKA